MHRLTVPSPAPAQGSMEKIYHAIARRSASGPVSACPAEMAAAAVRLCHAQSCGKCVPCRIGLRVLADELDKIPAGTATEKTLSQIESLAAAIRGGADCAIGTEAAALVLEQLPILKRDAEAHAAGSCAGAPLQAVPCTAACPAGVDIPGYIALVREGRYADAVRVIREDNPFANVCAYVCEHPCEKRCRRGLVDSAVNIRALKRYAVDSAGPVSPPARFPATGKRVAVVGAGPSGLTAAYYLSLMGHEVTVFERQEQPGGMLRYGIPAYRLPRAKLNEDIAAVRAAGVTIRTACDITAGNILELKENYDCVYIAAGAQGDKKLGVPGEDAPGVQSAVELLRALGAGERPDFTGRTVAVVGGGNVAMDAARSLVRLGAARVLLVYRRRVEDMPANPEEVSGARAEGVVMMPMLAPVRVEVKNGRAAALVVQPQRTGKLDAAGRPSPVKADAPEAEIACDAVVVAIGQDIQTAWLAPLGVPLRRGAVAADAGGLAAAGVFAGGDCVSGPATAVRAVAAGKAAAANIDAYLGFDHRLPPAAGRPEKRAGSLPPHGRVTLAEEEADLRKRDFALIERGMSLEEANQEAARCLGCDKCGPANIRGGRRPW